MEINTFEGRSVYFHQFFYTYNELISSKAKNDEIRLIIRIYYDMLIYIQIDFVKEQI